MEAGCRHETLYVVSKYINLHNILPQSLKIVKKQSGNKSIPVERYLENPSILRG